MKEQSFEIRKYIEEYRDQMLEVWERSVVATHDFLVPGDFQAIREIVHAIDFNSLEVYCMVSGRSVLGFIGVAHQKVEMLFVSPNNFGQGTGKKLLDFAIAELKADKVDVNEQNIKAIGFYEKYGFETYERTSMDDQGNPYPLLRMKLIGS